MSDLNLWGRWRMTPWKKLVFRGFLLMAFSFHLQVSAIVPYGMSPNMVGAKKNIKPLRVGVVGLVHSHVHWILGREKRGDIEIVGIVEPNRPLAQKYSEQHGFGMELVFDTLEEMVAAARPEAVTAFNSIFDHLETVKFCAPRGIHVMVEKPLAVTMEHARQMAGLARKHSIYLLTNYETSWYGSNYLAYDSIHKNKAIGEIRKMVFHTGHPGPVEIGCNPEFLEWLTDPVLNGGGALTDFGCYGANLTTWFMRGLPPVSVSCIAQQIKPHLYPRVEDEATIVLTYPRAQVIIQASWNWPHNVKDMEVYGTSGFIHCKNRRDVVYFKNEKEGVRALQAPALAEGFDDPFALLFKVVREAYKLPPYAPSSLENNLLVMQILEVARVAAENNSTVQWTEFYK